MVAVAVKDVDETFKKAIQNGATPILEPHDAYWGDRYAEFRDQAGIRYSVGDTACDVSASSTTTSQVAPVPVPGGHSDHNQVAELTPEQVKQKFDQFQKDHGNPTTPAKIVGVNTAAIVNAMPAVRLAFAPNDSKLTPESRTELAFVADYLKENPDKKIVIVGHADAVGAPDDELMVLSQKRAKVVTDELIHNHGIQSSRLKPQGAGALAPVASNSTPEGRALNRRVEFVEA